MTIFAAQKTETKQIGGMYYKILILALAGLAAAACTKETGGETKASYKTMTLRSESRTLRQEYTARLEGRQVVEIRPQVSGLITEIRIDEGQKVRKGQTLFVIDQVPYRAALAEAEARVKSAGARLATARLNLESTETLRRQNIVQDYSLATSRNELAAAEAALAEAEAAETNARNNLRYTEVKSPVDGVAGMIAYRTGALVGSGIGDPLVTVSDDSRMYAYFSMNEIQVAELAERYGGTDGFMRQAADVELRMAGGRPYGQKGRISAVSGIVNGGTGAVTLRAEFPNPQGLLRDGGSATVIVPTLLPQAVVIPQGATYELQDRRFAYKVVGGRATSVPVTLYSLDDGREYIVEDGLEAGDVIIAEGAGLVKEGAEVDTTTAERSRP